MKVLFLFHGSTHYFNLVLNKLNNVQNLELVYVKFKGYTKHIGKGVLQTTDNCNFNIYEINENNIVDELIVVIKNEKPHIIVLVEHFLFFLYSNKKLKDIIKKNGIKIILKSHPFQLKKFNELINELEPIKLTFKRVPLSLRKIISILCIDKLRKKQWEKKQLKPLIIKREMYNFPDAHVNYIEEAIDIYGSYGVSKEKIFITYNSPDTDYYFKVKEVIEKQESILPYNPHRIIHLSRLVQWKKVDLLINAFSKIKNEYSNSELLIIGEGPEKENLIRQVEGLNLCDSVLFTGGVYEAELLGKYIMASTVYVLAGMGGLSINDAMIFGLPVICSVCDGTEKKLVREGYNGLYFNENDENDLVKKIKYIFDNPEKSKQMGINSVEIIKNEINIHTVIKGYLDAFNYVLNN